MNWDDDRDTPADPRKCLACGTEKVCPTCSPKPDTRPDAEDLRVGWQLRTPLHRWETVTAVDSQIDGFSSLVRVWTDNTGPGYCLVYLRWDKVIAHPPDPQSDGTPEVRVIESFRPDGPMYAVITSSTVRQPDTHLALVQAHTPGRGQGWKLAHWRNGTELVTVEGLTKAAARAGLRRAAREHAHALNVKLVLPTREDNPR
jgi:hypothetical protein